MGAHVRQHGLHCQPDGPRDDGFGDGVQAVQV